MWQTPSLKGLDDEIQQYINTLIKAGTLVRLSVVVAAAKGSVSSAIIAFSECGG